MEFDSEINYANVSLNESFLVTDNPNTSLNFSLTTEVPYVDYGERPETYIVPFIFAIIFLVGVLGNGCLILIFFRHRTMRNVPNM